MAEETVVDAPVAAAPAASPAPTPAPAAAPAATPTPAATSASAPAPSATPAPAAAPAASPAPAAAPAASPAPTPVPEYKFVAPENMALDPVVSTEFAKVAGELNISPEAAQKVLDKMLPVLAKGDQARDQARIEAAVNKAKETWVAEAKADKEFGGEALDANLAIAKRTFSEFGTPALQALLEASGLDSHPELLRWAFRVGKQLSPDGDVVNGNNGPSGAKSFEERASESLYGNKK